MVSKFYKLLEEGKIYEIRRFNVLDSDKDYRSIEEKWTIHVKRDTNVKKIFFKTGVLFDLYRKLTCNSQHYASEINEIKEQASFIVNYVMLQNCHRVNILFENFELR